MKFSEIPDLCLFTIYTFCDLIDIIENHLLCMRIYTFFQKDVIRKLIWSNVPRQISLKPKNNLPFPFPCVQQFFQFENTFCCTFDDTKIAIFKIAAIDAECIAKILYQDAKMQNYWLVSGVNNTNILSSIKWMDEKKTFSLFNFMKGMDEITLAKQNMLHEDYFKKDKRRWWKKRIRISDRYLFGAYMVDMTNDKKFEVVVYDLNGNLIRILHYEENVFNFEFDVTNDHVVIVIRSFEDGTHIIVYELGSFRLIARTEMKPKSVYDVKISTKYILIHYYDQMIQVRVLTTPQLVLFTSQWPTTIQHIGILNNGLFIDMNFYPFLTK